MCTGSHSCQDTGHTLDRPSLPRLVSPTLALPPPHLQPSLKLCSPALLVLNTPGPEHSMYTNTSEGEGASVGNFYFSHKCPPEV